MSCVVQLRYFTATSPTNVLVRVKINAYMRIPAGQCRAPIIKFETSAGQIHLEGTALEFDAISANSFFVQAGFITSSAGVGRRRLQATGLLGFYNTLRDVQMNTPADTCLPTLPSVPEKLVTMSTKVTACGMKCVDSGGFVLDDLVGTKMIGGRPFIESQESLKSDGDRWMLTKKFPRYPELLVHTVGNGSATMRWSEFEGRKFHCALSVSNETQTAELAANSAIKSDVPPTVTYEGVTLFSGERYTDVSATQYSFRWGETGMKIDYFATASNLNRSLAIKAWGFNEDIDQYELHTRQEFSVFQTDADATIADGTFDFPTDCVTDPDVVAPPNPRGMEVGTDVIKSSNSPYTWGGPVPAVEDNNITFTNDTSSSGTGRRLLSCTTAGECSQTWGPISTTINPSERTFDISASGTLPPPVHFIEVTGGANFCVDPSKYSAGGYLRFSLGCTSVLGFFGLDWAPVKWVCPSSGTFLSAGLAATYHNSGQATCNFGKDGNGYNYYTTPIFVVKGDVTAGPLGCCTATIKASLFAEMRFVPDGGGWIDTGMRAGVNAEWTWPFNKDEATYIITPASVGSGNKCWNYYSTKENNGADAVKTKSMFTFKLFPEPGFELA